MSQAPQDSLQLMTFNVRCCTAHDASPNSWEERVPRIRQFLRRVKPALFGVQEAYCNQLTDLLEDSPFRFIGGGRDDFHTQGESSALFYEPTRLAVIDSGNFALNDDPRVPGVRAWGAVCPRMATWGLFRDLATGQRFSCYNTHLDHVSGEAQRNGLKLILSHMAAHYAHFPQVLMGDFNATPQNEVWSLASTVLEDSRGISLGGVQGPSETYHGWGKEAKTIDYIFVSQGLTVLEYLVDDQPAAGGFLSDHYPVLVKLMFGSTRRPLVLA